MDGGEGLKQGPKVHSYIVRVHIPVKHLRTVSLLPACRVEFDPILENPGV
jgi:hypothetical protein